MSVSVQDTIVMLGQPKELYRRSIPLEVPVSEEALDRDFSSLEQCLEVKGREKGYIY